MPQEVAREGLAEAGARNSAADMKRIQAIHDTAAEMGAACTPPISEAALLQSQSDASKLELIRKAVNNKYPLVSPWIRDSFADCVIVCVSFGVLHKIPYTIDGDNVMLGEPIEVETAYVPVTGEENEALREALRKAQGVIIGVRPPPAAAPPEPPPAEHAQEAGDGAATEPDAALVHLTESSCALTETAVAEDGTINLKVMSPGWGTSGYYGAEMLARDANRAFPVKTLMFADHPTAKEEAEKPERSIRDLMAETITAASYDPNGPDGPGVYAKAKVLEPWRAFVEQYAPHIGISIRAIGKAKQGEAEGRRGPVVESLDKGKSIDFVTRAGRDGKVLTESLRALWESTRTQDPTDLSTTPEAALTQPQETTPIQEQNTMDEKQLQALQEAAAETARLKTQIARLTERNLIAEAKAYASANIKGVPDITKARLTESLSVNPPANEQGELDTAKFLTAIDEAVKTEAAYLAKATGKGQVRDLGSTAAEVKDDQLDAMIESGFRALGLTESAAKFAAQGRN